MLVKLKWTPELSANHKVIDDQHKKLFGILNKLIDARSKEDKNQTVIEIIKEMIDYSGAHFSEESRHMYEMQYPRIEQHMNEHLEFTKKVAEFLDDYEKGKATLSEDILKYLTTWWLNHVSKSDMGYKGFVRRS